MASSATAEVIARLRLNAEQFSADSGKAWSEYEERAKQAGSSIKRDIGGALSEIAASAKVALTLPTLDSGQINLNTQALRNRADAARQEAIVLREVATAAERAANSQDRATDEARAYAVASSQLAQNAEEHASALRREADALDRVQAELGQTARSSAVFGAQQKAVNDNSRAQQAAFQNLGFQMQDFAVQVAGGTSVMRALAQQAPQAINAVGDLGSAAGAGAGRFANFAKVLGGPVGIAIGVAIPVVAGLASALFESSTAADGAEKSTIDFSSSLAASQGVVGNYSNAIEQLTQATRGLINTQALLIENSRAFGESSVQQLNTQAREVDKQIAERRRNLSVGLPWFMTPSAAYDRYKLGQPEEQRKQLTEDIGKAQSAVATAQTALEARRANEAADPKLAARGKIERERARLVERRKYTLEQGDVPLQGAGGLNLISEADFGKQMAELRRREQAIDNADKDAAKKRSDARRAEAAERAAARKAEREGRAADRSAEYGRDTADKIAAIGSRFAGDPSRVQQANKAVAELNDIIDDLQRKKPPNFDDLIDSAERAKAVVQDSLSQPFRDLVESAREREQIDQLILAGQLDQAEALQRQIALEKQMGPLAEDQKATLLEIVRAEEARARAIEDQRRKIGLVVQSVGEVRGAFEELLSGGSVGDFGKSLLRSFKGLQVRIISEQLFGGLEREIEDLITGRSGMKAAGEFLEQEARNSGSALQDFVRSVKDTADRLGALTISAAPVAAAGGGASPLALATRVLGSERPKLDIDIGDLRALASAEQDEIDGTLRELSSGIQDIVVIGSKLVQGKGSIQRLDPAQIFNEIGRGGIGKALEGILGKDAAKAIGGTLGTGLQGASYGQLAGSIVGKGGTGSAIGGAIGAVAGSFLPIPGGQIIGSVVGGLVGGLFDSKKKPLARAYVDENGADLWSRKDTTDAIGQLSRSVAESLDGMAAQLGVTVGKYGLTIGSRDGEYRVSQFYGADTVKKNPTAGTDGIIYKGKDAQKAAEAAIINAIEDGALNGISEASKRILTSGKNLDKALQQALTIESIPKELKRRLDPVGFAIDSVNTRFEQIRKTLTEAGGSAEQMAQAQKLYNLELAEAKASAGGAADSLKDFLQSLKAGSGSYLSLTEQEANARAALQPYLDQIGRGEAIDQQKYLEASQTFLDIERELYGSTSKFFDALSEIQAATANAISTIDNATPIRTTSDPFIQETAQAAKATAASTSNLQTLMAQAVALLDQIASQGGGTVDEWLAQKRGFA